ncbi:MAG: dTDP-glucose 4,6-dehydratase [Omnitrophica bacterium RIFCSPLOWO2_12_FULL_44_17]|uniref:dTDP-glucose 4,6-dehydratase n=1 Tax=Candidatus Danuiimicrobium aquiferis TaxID=1801832 RepID=A0A1G1KTS1_9BACT|nr:MAG: dTDP-glucose 4,6-dehydratase [Omnitrophica bacterium RIFCSPHIGHO2_02_FULL_45_28]OGW90189.1 MAG: dTDP-glucose 4,6-dehydratase [Omnitrophica bacterium RIFCSPHIGHO2_12_FULL_44_12]OGW96353.1 MAG: dTDP-glucose 4,6-dehydratase [Omnitrophica bacterium RIFCSPLOWO2_12_FULL_44_17]OGX04838.1 MAG: dTDP-glucose 4,6-dehydratase [Omnitrophica bacterium RIFCSPLOWO2_02_FULL_44_11]
MNRVLVTGGSGFIGSNFLRYFLNKFKDISVINLDKLTYAGLRSNTVEHETNPRYEFVHGDICNAELVKSLMSRVDSVIHFAAETHVDRSIDSPDEFVRTNVLGTNTLLNAAKNAKLKRFIHFSTDEVYGSIKQGSFTETFPLDPSSPYSAAKAASDLLALAYHKTHGIPVIIMRCTNNYGPYHFPEKVIPLFITNLIEGKKVPLYAKGGNVRDWLYVEDTARAVSFVFEHGKIGEIYNVAGRCELSNIELTGMILKEFGKGEEMIQYVKDRLAHDFRYSLDMSKLEALGFEITSTIHDNLRKTIDWYRANEAWWRKLKADRYTLK